MNPKPFPLRVLLITAIFVILLPLMPLLISGEWGWWQAWVYAGLAIFGFIISRALARRRNPDLLAERAKFLRHPDAKPWDRWLAPLVGLGGGLIPVVAGLDARFGWSSGFPLWLELLALAVILVGYWLASYALIENRFFSGMVRLQTDRGQHVVRSGPYRWLRHPGYAGSLLTYLATPLLLDSSWTFLASALITTALVVRTALEDRTLQEELEGYRDYAKEVRWRLLPGVW